MVKFTTKNKSTLVSLTPLYWNMRTANNRRENFHTLFTNMEIYDN